MEQKNQSHGSFSLLLHVGAGLDSGLCASSALQVCFEVLNDFFELCGGSREAGRSVSPGWLQLHTHQQGLSPLKVKGEKVFQEV